MVEHLAFDGAALEDRPLRRVELVEARREQCLKRRRHLDLAVAGRLHHRRHLLDEERVSARGTQDSLAHVGAELSSADAASISASACSGASGSNRRTPPQPLRRSRSSGRAMQSSRIGAPVDRNATCSRRSRKTSSPHWMSSKTTTRGLSAATPSSSLRNAHAISSVEDVPPSPENGVERVGRNGIELESRPVRLELLQHLDHRPVGDPLPVGEAAPADDRRVRGREELRHQARLSHPRRPDDRDQLAVCPLRARSHASPSAPSSRSRPTRTESKRRSAAAVDTATSRHAGTGSRLPFSVRARQAPPRPRLEPDGASSRRAGSHRAARPAAAARRR